MHYVRFATLIFVVFASALVLDLSALGAEPSSSDWTRWRGPGGYGISDARGFPLEWGEHGKNILWKTEIEGRGQSSPVITGDRVFLTTAIEGEEIEGIEVPIHHFGDQEFKHPMSMGGTRHHILKVLAIDTTTGAIDWSHVAYEGRVFQNRHQQSSYASPSIATDGEAVFAYFGSQGVYAYSVDGKALWSTSIGNIKTVGLGVGTSPVLHGDLLIIQADEDVGENSFIVALDKKTGEEVWKTARPVQASWTTPAIIEHNGRTVVVTPGYEFLIAYDPSNGSEVWRVDGLENNAIHVPLHHDGNVIVTSGYPEKITLSIPLDIEGDLSGKKAYDWKYEKGAAYVPSNLLYDGYLYLTNDGGVITCLDASTGNVVYEGGRLPIRGRYSASMVAADGKILMTNNDGDSAFFKAGPEFEVLSSASVDEPVWATPAIVGERIYIRADRHLFAIGHPETKAKTTTGP